jgi:5-methylthioribose kinase
MGRFCARTAFRGSDLSMEAPKKKADVALFAGNVELCDITENLVFTDPYFDATLNRHTTPQLDAVVADLRADAALKIEAQHMKRAFTARAETLCHGDLHAGSIMVTDDETRVIDPEFAFYGPFGFDIGMLVGNYLMAFHSLRAHVAEPGERARLQEFLLTTAAETWDAFTAEFTRLWHTERTGILYARTLYEDQGDGRERDRAARASGRDLRRSRRLRRHRDAPPHPRPRPCGRTRHIEDPDLRAPIEERCLRLGRDLVLNRRRITDMDTVLAMARAREGDRA